MSRIALVVDDSMLIRHMVCRFLEQRGFSVESAANGREALDLLAAVKPDLIVTDLEMPRMSGGELIAELKKDGGTAVIPVVVLAGKKTGVPVAEAKFANYVIYKDIDIEAQLQRALAVALRDLEKPTN